jgi:hypothetical protein
MANEPELTRARRSDPGRNVLNGDQTDFLAGTVTAATISPGHRHAGLIAA